MILVALVIFLTLAGYAGTIAEEWTILFYLNLISAIKMVKI